MTGVRGSGLPNLGTDSFHEKRMRRAVGGGVDDPGAQARGLEAKMATAVGRAVEAGLELQLAARAAAADMEEDIRKEVKRMTTARSWAKDWMRAVVRGGPRRATAFGEVAEATAEATRRVETARTAGEMTTENASVAVGRIEEMARRLLQRLRSTVASLSERRGLVEWRAAAVYGAWRWRTAVAGDRGLQVGVLVEPTAAWQALMRAGEVEATEERRYWPATSGNARLTGEEGRRWREEERGRRLSEGKAPGLDRRAASARAWWQRGGGRRRAEWLRGEEVQAGRC